MLSSANQEITQQTAMYTITHIAHFTNIAHQIHSTQRIFTNTSG